MTRFLAILALLGAAALAGCGTSCSPSAAYTIPAHWDQSYYSNESQFSHWHYYQNCGYHYSYSSGRSRYYCQTESSPVYYYYQQYHPAVYHPRQYIHAVICTKSGPS